MVPNIRHNILAVMSLLTINAFVTEAQIADTNQALSNAGTVLGLDIRSFLRENYNVTDASNAEVELTPRNFLNTDSARADYLLEIRIDDENWHDRVNFVFVFVNESSSYKRKFLWDGWGKAYFSHPDLIDIDSDGRSEILIEADHSGNGETTDEVDIWKLNDTGFVNIFHEDLELSSGLPYGYHNKYRFVRNRRNSLLSDIEFIIDAGVQGTDAEVFTPKQYKNAYGVFPPKQIRKTLLFSFDGVRYTPNEPVPDYHAFLKRWERSK